MCGRYVVIKSMTRIEKQFGIHLKLKNSGQFQNWQSNYNVSATDWAPIICSDAPDVLQLASFGYSPSWSEKRMCILNTRTEGKSNQNNDPNYRGAKNVLKSKMWAQALRHQRCVVIADAFIEGPEHEKLSKPYVVYVIGQKPIVLAGLYSDWVDQRTGEVVRTFSIFTQVANKVCREIGHHRSPVIIAKEDIATWLNVSSELQEVTDMLRPYPGPMNAFPVDPKLIKSGKMKDRAIIEPIGERIFKEYEYQNHKSIELQGMGEAPARKRRMQESDNIDDNNKLT